MSDKIRVAVITGEHAFDVTGFYGVFSAMPAVDFYPQDLSIFAIDPERKRIRYDVLLFYNFHQATPADEEDYWRKAIWHALTQLGEAQQGIFLLHHAILAFPQWPLWSEICGIADRKFGYHDNQDIRVQIANPDHPITQGLNAWEMRDETYSMNSAGEGSDILLTTQHPKSMRVLAWTRRYKNAHVFCYQAGHDNQTYANPNFRTVVARGIQWAAGRI